MSFSARGEVVAEKLGITGKIDERHPSGAKAHVD
jgi:hypothetical protein